ncbi:MAG: imidazoleglycerol-phosphate dehydratase HisB [Spirochaetales bacterium]|nr:imidazoleglycerol-phosphate dehydratase HisB [Spirochaetales bacterium]
MNRIIRHERTTKETSISVILNGSERDDIAIETPVAFFNHMLHAMCFHGGFGLALKGTGDIDVDFHHLVEDTGLVLGYCFAKLRTDFGPVKRWGRAVIPMDEALAEVTIDASGRPFLVYTADFPQEYAGDFPMILVQEFLTAFSNAAGINLHAACRYGSNSHHMAEALFKALGKALNQAFAPADAIESTKGSL